MLGTVALERRCSQLSKIKVRDYDPPWDTWLILSKPRTKIKMTPKIVPTLWAIAEPTVGSKLDTQLPFPSNWMEKVMLAIFQERVGPTKRKTAKSVDMYVQCYNFCLRCTTLPPPPPCGCLAYLASLPPWHPWLEYTDNNN